MAGKDQARQISWGTLLEILWKVPTGSSNKYQIQELCFTPDKQGKIFGRLSGFATTVEASIQEFSKTERAKYNNQYLDNLTETCDKESCNKFLTEDLQKVAAWTRVISSCKNKFVGDIPSKGGILDAIRELFIQDKAPALLCLARKGLPFEKFQFVSNGKFFHYGLWRIMEDCLSLYIHLNLLLATGSLTAPEQWHYQWHLFLIREIQWEHDGNPHARMYREYFKNNPKFEDLEGLQKLMKKVFRTMYLYDMVMAERGKKVRWVHEVLLCLGHFVEQRDKIPSIWYQQLLRAREETNNAEKLKQESDN